jgi:hypothetical protein
MALGDPIVLKDYSAADHNFDKQSQAVLKDGTVQSVYVDRASSAVEPITLTIRQKVTGRGPTLVRRTLVQITQVIISSTTGLPSQWTQNYSWVYPLNGTATPTHAYNSIAMLGDLLGGTVTVDTTRTGYLLQGQN